ncbi:hypothetical protein DL95DRAFT_522280 [Leptodontidium sp. 2 PMI_412]|nr:hypothetical protein DL95DRAFT_522280 [Leptodontidium sp. 2 PMI_412]
MRNRHSNPLRDLKPLSPITETLKDTSSYTISETTRGRRFSSSATQYERRRAQRTEKNSPICQDARTEAGSKGSGNTCTEDAGRTSRLVDDRSAWERNERNWRGRDTSTRSVLRREDATLGSDTALRSEKQEQQPRTDIEIETMDRIDMGGHERIKLGDSCCCGYH